MLTKTLHENNRLIRKTILRMYPVNFIFNLTVSIALMVDTLLAGAILGQDAIAAVAVGLPAIGIFQALTLTVVNGTGIKLAVAAGRSKYEQMNRIFSLGIVATVVAGLGFLAVGLLLADPLTRLLGGAKNPAVAAQAAMYLRASSVCILMGSMNTLLGKVLALYGHQRVVFISSLIAMIGNIAFSLLYIRILPAHLAICGLGAGTWTGGLLACTCSAVMLKVKKIPLRLRLKDAGIRELPEIIRSGAATSGNSLADGVVSGIANNIIVAGFGGDTAALAVYTAVKGVISFALAAVQSTATAMAPLLGILCGARDKNGILRSLKEGFKVGLGATVIWGGIIAAAIPLLAKFYGMGGIPQFRQGVIFCLLFLPLLLLMRILTQLFESTEKAGMGLLYSVVPDSVIYPILLALLLPLLGYNGLWLAYSANAIPFLVVLFLVRSVKNRTFRLSADRVLCLSEAIRDNVPMLDISIGSNNTDVTRISRQVHAFLTGQNASPRTAYITSLCLEELTADFVAHTLQEDPKAAERTIMDIKLFSDTDTLRIIIRNAASAYNPLDFQLDTNTFAKVGVKLAQKVSRHIDYTYIYQMNIITIDVDK